MNKNTVPNETRSPFVTSGVRIGVPLVTSRGMTEEATAAIGGFICDILDDAANIGRVADQVKELCRQYPLYKETIAT